MGERERERERERSHPIATASFSSFLSDLISPIFFHLLSYQSHIFSLAVSIQPTKMTDSKDAFDMDDIAADLPAVAALSREDRAGLLNALKSKLRDLAGDAAPVLESLAPMVRKRVEALRQLQSQHNELEAKFFVERAALEAKYQKLYQPLYSKRYEIVNGNVEVEGVTDDDEAKKRDENAPEEKGVPDFWLNAMKTNEVLAEEITERDGGALHYLKDIKWCRIGDFKGFKLEFFFDTNPYFKNTTLTKTYHMVDEDEPILEKAIGTEIEWHSGKCLTQKLLKKKSKKGGKIITKTEKCESFFNFFNPPKVPEEGDEIDEDIAEELQNEMDLDYEIGTTIRDKIIPHAVSWFTGEAAQEDEFEAMDDDDDDDDDDDEEDDEDDDEDDDEEEEDEEEEEKPKGRKK